jgi:LPS sulfotransferase NodH
MKARQMAMLHLARSRAIRHAFADINGHATAAQMPAWASATATYIICTNPRSGSWLLSDGLSSTSEAGNPREWFNLTEEQKYRAQWRMGHETNLNFANYLRMARDDSTTSNGISGIKLHYYQMLDLRKKIETIENIPGLTNISMMSRLFPHAKYLWLRRRDKARQAISLYIASHTDEWWSIDGVVPEKRDGVNSDPPFDARAIARIEATLQGGDAKWQAYFQASGIVPLVVYYEDMAAKYHEIIASVLKWLDVANADAVVVPPARLKRQSGVRNEEWLSRYLALENQRGDLAQGASSDLAQDQRFEQIKTNIGKIPDSWKQWVAQSKLGKVKDAEMVGVLTSNGYSAAAAAAELERASTDPYLLGAQCTQQRLEKGASLLNAIGQMARLDSRASTVERRAKLSLDAFRDEYYAANRPVLIQDKMSDWRAMTAWTPDYLKGVAGNGMIEVMTGRNADPKYEMRGAHHRTELRFSDYVDMVYSGKVTNDYFLVANNAFFQKAAAQPLVGDFTPLPEYLNSVASNRRRFFWFGPAGTLTPLHQATSNILFAQVAGRRRYRLIPATQWQCVYNTIGVFSDVDGENPDLGRYPKFREASVIDIVVEPGEMLFMPVGWWHHARALDVSMTISFTNFVFPNHFTWE